MRYFCLPESSSVRTAPMQSQAATERVTPEHLLGALEKLPGIFNVYTQVRDPAARHFLARLAIILLEGGISCGEAYPPERLRAVLEDRHHEHLFQAFGDNLRPSDHVFGCARPGNKLVWPIMIAACRHLLHTPVLPSDPLTTFIRDAGLNTLRHGLVVHPIPSVPVPQRQKKSHQKGSWHGPSSRYPRHTTTTMRLWKG